MAERTEGTKTIKASAADILDVIADFESYPKWSDVKKVKVKKKDRQGRGTEVEYEISQFGITAKYTLGYRYKAREGGCSWTTKSVEEGPIKDIKGEYVLEELDEDETEVTYKMAIELATKVPSMIRNRAEKMIIKNALDGLKKRVERG